MKKEILLLDRAAQSRELLKTCLMHEQYQVSTFTRPAACLSALQAASPSLLIAYLDSCRETGVSICAEVRRLSSLPLLLLQNSTDSMERITALSLGADAVLSEEASPMEILAQVKALLRRAESAPMDKPSAPQTLSYGPLHLQPLARTASLAGSPLRLTPHEFDFLCYLLRQGGAASKAELLHSIWQIDGFQTETTVTEDLVKRLRRKLTAAGNQVQIETIWGYGYRLVLSPSDRLHPKQSNDNFPDPYHPPC